MKVYEKRNYSGKLHASDSLKLREMAERHAISALGFLAAEPERLDMFLTQTGMTPHDLRGAAANPGFFAAILDYVASDERLLLACAAQISCDPAELARACHILSPQM